MAFVDVIVASKGLGLAQLSLRCPPQGTATRSPCRGRRNPPRDALRTPPVLVQPPSQSRPGPKPVTEPGPDERMPATRPPGHGQLPGTRPQTAKNRAVGPRAGTPTHVRQRQTPAPSPSPPREDGGGHSPMAATPHLVDVPCLIPSCVEASSIAARPTSEEGQGTGPPSRACPTRRPPPVRPPPANQRRSNADRDPDRDSPDRIPATSAVAAHHCFPAKQTSDLAVPATESPTGHRAPHHRAAEPRRHHREKGREGEAPPPPAPHRLRPADALRRRRGGGSTRGRGEAPVADLGLP